LWSRPGATNGNRSHRQARREGPSCLRALEKTCCCKAAFPFPRSCSEPHTAWMLQQAYAEAEEP